MANITYGSILNWKLLPVLSLHIIFEDDTHYEFTYPEASSEINIDQITDENDSGGVSPVAISITGKYIEIRNNFGDMLPFFKSVSTKKCKFFYLWTGIGAGTPGGSLPPGAGIMMVNREHTTIGDDPPTVLSIEDCSVTYSIKYSGISPKLTINFSGIISHDILDSIQSGNNKLFNQYWTKHT